MESQGRRDRRKRPRRPWLFPAARGFASTANWLRRALVHIQGDSAMPMAMFHSFFPKLAEDECRYAILEKAAPPATTRCRPANMPSRNCIAMSRIAIASA